MAPKAKKTAIKSPAKTRTFESETLSFDALTVLAAPNPQNDLSPEEMLRYAQANSHSPELIQQLIDFIRKL